MLPGVCHNTDGIGATYGACSPHVRLWDGQLEQQPYGCKSVSYQPPTSCLDQSGPRRRRSQGTLQVIRVILVHCKFNTGQYILIQVKYMTIHDNTCGYKPIRVFVLSHFFGQINEIHTNTSKYIPIQTYTYQYTAIQSNTSFVLFFLLPIREIWEFQIS